MKYIVTVSTILLALFVVNMASAAPVKVYVGEMNAAGVANRDELKLTLQTLLASRLNSEAVMSVGSAAEADALVSGTYVVIGRVFSLEAVVRSKAGITVIRSFVQGDNQDDLIPAVGRLAEKLATELAKKPLPPNASPTPSISSVPSVAPSAEIIRTESQIRPAASGDIIRAKDIEQGMSGGWVSKRLAGASNLLAVSAVQSDGSRYVYLAEDSRISCYRLKGELTPVAEAELNFSEKIVSLDVLGDDVFVSVIRGSEPLSQVWQVRDGKLVQAAKGIAWFMRVFSLAGGPAKLYVQGMGRDADFYGDVFEAAWNGRELTVKSPIKMPRHGTIYSFNQFKTADGTVLTVAINPDNYLVVYDQEQKELWRSNDKFGGSELFFQKADADPRISGSTFRSIFMNQKLQVNGRNELLVGKNDGFWVLGDARSYKKGAVYCLTWNGSSLEEKWRTKDTQNYMPDYWYDDDRKVLMMLQVVQRPATLGSDRGASSLSIKKVE